MEPSPQPERQRQIEREFGVPVPGKIVPQSEWTQTAFKKFPSGHLDWMQIFGRQAPVMLDLGCGNGRSTLSSAVWRSSIDHFSVDILPVVIRYATRRANQRGLQNVRFAVLGGRELLADHVAPGSVAEIHCYHPQPFYDPGQVHKRLITPEFLTLTHRALSPDGLLILQTDNPGYWKYMLQAVPLFFEFSEQPGRWPDAPKGRTRREILALRQGLPVFRGTGRPRANLTATEALKLAESLPAPTFDADRRLQSLDALERE